MPNAIQQAMDATGSAWNTLSSDASALWNRLPSVGGSAPPPVSPATNLPSATSSAAPTTPLASPSPVSAPPVSGTAAAPAVASPPTPAPNPTGSKPAAQEPSTLTKVGGAAAAIAEALEFFQRYQLQRNLQNPNWVKAQIAKLQKPLSADLKNSITNTVSAQMQEAGLGQAPGLFQQALAQALAPYQQKEEELAAQEFEGAIGASEGAYPVGDGLSDFSKQLAGIYGTP